MKKTISIFTILILTVNLFSQTPEKMSYQAIIRDASNNLISSSAVGMQISILQGSPSGTSVYVEIQNQNTNNNGLISVEIGNGTVVSGDFSTIDWSNGPYFIKTETDPSGGNNYTISGTSQLMSVPYALYAKTADSLANGITEFDPVFGASIASGISVVDTSFWNNKLDSSSIVWSKNLDNIYFNSGKIGIGTVNPSWRFHVVDTLPISSSSSLKLEIESGSQTDTIYRGIRSIIKGTGGFNRAIQGSSQGFSSQTNQGVVGFGLNAITNTGVYGASNEPNLNTNGFNFGIVGFSQKSEFSNIAVGAYAEGGNTIAGDNFALSAISSSTTPGVNFGVYAEAINGGFNYAGFFNGDVLVTGNLTSPSDIKLKSNIKQMNNAMVIIRELNPVEYDYKQEISGKNLNLPKSHQYGFIAQEIQKVLPELVSNQKINLGTVGRANFDNENNNEKLNERTPETFEFIGVNYTSIIPILVQGIKEQDARIEELENIVFKMQKQIEQLQKQ